jgi:predicted MFS family arabinose efflux permease
MDTRAALDSIHSGAPPATYGPLGSSAPTVHPWSLYGPWQRWLYFGLLFAVTAFNYFDYFIVAVLLEPIKQEFHVSDTALGLLSGMCFALIFAAAAVPIARWADRGNRRTVITVALSGWSVMTIACGFAQSFWQLALARFGVGITEPGAMPPSQSLIADYFPPERRASATSILCGGASSVGWLLGIGIGGLIASRYGWRVAFVLAGVPGLLLALIVRAVLPEPRTHLLATVKRCDIETAWQSIGQLRRKQSFVLSVVAISVYAIFSYGVTAFVASFMTRSFHAPMTDVSGPLGCAIAVANLVGSAIGGWVADKLGSRNPRWYARLPACACIVALPLYLLALSADNLGLAIGIEFFAEVVLGVGIPVVFTTIMVVCGGHRRSIASAVLYCAMVLIGGSLGPFLTGVLSDSFAAAAGVDSLRYALIAMCAFLLPAAAAFWASGGAIFQDEEA